MSVLSRTLTLLTALPLLAGVSATAAQASPATAPTASPVVATSPAPGSEPASVAGAAIAAADGWGGYQNGYIPASAMCPIPWQTVDHLRCDALAKFAALNALYKATFGANICVNDAYRSYAKQVTLYNELGPNVAAVPGTSNHGWAIAADLGCGVGIFGNARHVWFSENAPKYGWAQPTWALQGSSRAEAWHWQYFGAYTAPTVPATTKAATTAIIGITGTWPRIATVTIRAKATGKVMAGASVTIKRRATTTTAYTTVGTYKTNTAGQLAYKYYPSVPTVVVMSYAGSATALPSAAGVTLTTPTVMSAKVTAGRPDQITGRLLTPGSKAVPAQTVYLQRRYAGSTTWTTVATLRTGSTGYVTSTQQPKRSTYYRFSYRGVASRYVSDLSPTVHVSY
ncbi:MAG: M15 family metallopeptidase [Ornithinibacter sp.]